MLAATMNGQKLSLHVRWIKFDAVDLYASNGFEVTLIEDFGL